MDEFCQGGSIAREASGENLPVARGSKVRLRWLRLRIDRTNSTRRPARAGARPRRPVNTIAEVVQGIELFTAPVWESPTIIPGPEIEIGIGAGERGEGADARLFAAAVPGVRPRIATLYAGKSCWRIIQALKLGRFERQLHMRWDVGEAQKVVPDGPLGAFEQGSVCELALAQLSSEANRRTSAAGGECVSPRANAGRLPNLARGAAGRDRRLGCRSDYRSQRPARPIPPFTA